MEWISVEDQLPEPNEIIIIYLKRYPLYLARYVRIYNGDTFYNDYFSIIPTNIEFPASHWMYLPKPPI
jgi:hypothetical protein